MTRAGQIIVLKNRKNNKGVTLVEVMISLVILLIVFLGLIQASLLTIQGNMKNVLRDEAVRITSDRMARLRVISFGDALVAVTTSTACPDFLDDTDHPDSPEIVTRRVRNADVDFSIRKVVTSLDTDHKQITLWTFWSWQGENFNCTNSNGVSMVATRGR
jgi:prepilin-type N-terminal cleavage/methylation domain-containing protein